MANRLIPGEIVEMRSSYAEYGNYAVVGCELRRNGTMDAKYIKLHGTPDIAEHTFKEVVRE